MKKERELLAGVDIPEILAQAWSVVKTVLTDAPPQVQAAALPIVWERLVCGHPQTESHTEVEKTPAVKHVGLSEILSEFKSANQYEWVAGLAYCLSEEGNSLFAVTDLKDGFERARQPLPKNFARAVTESIRRGYICQSNQRVDGKPTYYLTEKGRRLVEERLASED